MCSTPLANPFVDLQSQSRSAYPQPQPQVQVSQPQVVQDNVFYSTPPQPQAPYPTQSQPQAPPQSHDHDHHDHHPEQEGTTKRAPGHSPPVPQNTLANVPPQWPVEEHVAANPQWDDVESPTMGRSRSESPPHIPDSFDELSGGKGYALRQGTQGSDFYVPPPSPPPVERAGGGGKAKSGFGMPQCVTSWSIVSTLAHLCSVPPADPNTQRPRLCQSSHTEATIRRFLCLFLRSIALPHCTSLFLL